MRVVLIEATTHIFKYNIDALKWIVKTAIFIIYDIHLFLDACKEEKALDP